MPLLSEYNIAKDSVMCYCTMEICRPLATDSEDEVPLLIRRRKREGDGGGENSSKKKKSQGPSHKAASEA